MPPDYIAAGIAVLFLQGFCMKIKNIDGLSAADIQQAVKEGGKFVYYACTVSFLIITFRDTSGVYLVRPGDPVIAKSYVFTAISFLLGWWGIPWGPKYTLQAIRTNLKGGNDVTTEVMSIVKRHIGRQENKRA